MRKIKEMIDNLIGPPGYFIKIEGNNEIKSEKINSKKLDIFKNKDESKGVYATYAKSFNNSVSLLEEAKLLFQNKFYARAVALAIMSFEELGKSQIVADYYTGILTEEDYKRSFRDHGRKKSFAGRYKAFQVSNKKKGYNVKDLGFAFGTDSSTELEKIRQGALYVDENNNPLKDINEEDAEAIIKKVWEHISYVRYAEELNGRIGSKALFK